MSNLKLKSCLASITGMVFYSLASTPALSNGNDANTVNCNKPGASVQHVIDSMGQSGREGTVFIEGFCDERVSIVNDGIRLSGNGNHDGTIGGGLVEVVVTGAQRIVVEYLNLTGDGYGVLVHEGGSAKIAHNNIYDNEADGVGVYNQAFARVEFNSITGNGRAEFFEAGIEGGVNSGIRSRGNYIADNAYAAIEMGNMGYIRSGAFVPSGGEIDPADKDIVLQRGCTRGQTADECAMTAAAGTIAIDCFRNGICDLRNTEVVGETFISGLSNFDVRNTSINGNVGGSGGSRLHMRGSVTGSGFVSCFSEAFASSSVQCWNFIPSP